MLGSKCYYRYDSLYMVILPLKADITGHVTKRSEKKMNRKKYHSI